MSRAPTGMRLRRLVRSVSAFGLALGLACFGTGCDELTSRALVKEGNDLYKEGEFKAALAKYDEALALNPTLTKCWVNRVYACQQQFVPGVKNKENDALAECMIESADKVLAVDPKRTDLLNLKIQTWIDAARFDDAIAHFDTLLKKDPKDLEAVKSKGAILMRAGRFDEGLKMYYRRVELEPGNPEGLYTIGVLQWARLHDHDEYQGEQRREMADQALDPLNKALEINPEYVEAMVYINLVYRERALGWDREIPAENTGAIEDLKKADEWRSKSLVILKARAKAKKAAKEAAKESGSEPDEGTKAGEKDAKDDKK